MTQLIDALRQMPNPERPAHLHTGEGEIDSDTLTAIKQRLVAADEHRFIKLEYYHCDHLGTPIALSDLKGNIIWRAEYDPWGNILEEYNPDNIEQLIRFQGQQYDAESGLHYNRHRYYDPYVGAYITQDPIGLLGGVNPYGYAYRNPVSLTDPLGLFALLFAAGAGLAILGGYAILKNMYGFGKDIEEGMDAQKEHREKYNDLLSCIDHPIPEGCPKTVSELEKKENKVEELRQKVHREALEAYKKGINMPGTPSGGTLPTSPKDLIAPGINEVVDIIKKSDQTSSGN